mmetsp:Transcript_5951/g.13868  ORF Transcript_5951/g.13868 Transcript_5951/m.13868 type:complete len:282 (-) Transcript_5951:1399-2244(-)
MVNSVVSVAISGRSPKLAMLVLVKLKSMPVSTSPCGTRSIAGSVLPSSAPAPPRPLSALMSSLRRPLPPCLPPLERLVATVPLSSVGLSSPLSLPSSSDQLPIDLELSEPLPLAEPPSLPEPRLQNLRRCRCEAPPPEALSSSQAKLLPEVSRAREPKLCSFDGDPTLFSSPPTPLPPSKVKPPRLLTEPVGEKAEALEFQSPPMEGLRPIDGSTPGSSDLASALPLPSPPPPPLPSLVVAPYMALFGEGAPPPAMTVEAVELVRRLRWVTLASCKRSMPS